MDVFWLQLFLLLLLLHVYTAFSVPSNVSVQAVRVLGCNQFSYDNKRSGIISSPSYQTWDEIRKNGTTDEWRIVAKPYERIHLIITKIDIVKSPGCELGYLEVRDGLWSTSPSLGKYCGKNETRVDPIFSQGNKMFILYYVLNPGHQGFTAKFETFCGCDFYLEKKRIITSPGYPNNYPTGSNCKYKIIAPDGHRVVLTFQALDLENEINCRYDYVQVRNGPTENSTLIGTYCKSKLPSQIISENNFLHIQFVSDDSVGGKGFSATAVNEYDECTTGNHQCSQECVNTIGSYKCLCKEGYELKPDGKTCEACGGKITSSNGTVASPSFYRPNRTCIWEVRTWLDTQVKLEFTQLNLGDENECGFDRVEIYSILDNNETRLGVYCGQQLPDKIKSESNAVKIVFKTGSSGKDAEFSLNYRATIDPCSVNNGSCKRKCGITRKSNVHCYCPTSYSERWETGEEYKRDCEFRDCVREYASPSGLLASHNYPKGYDAGLNCKWSFTNTPGHRIKITFKDFYLQQAYPQCDGDNVTFYDGPSTNYTSFGVLCGRSFLPDPIMSSTNQLFATMKSDDWYLVRGFLAERASICGGTLQADIKEENYIYSHANFSLSNYNDNTICEWILKTKEGYRISVALTFFILEFSDDCNSDHVEIFDGENYRAPSLGKFCGLELPPVIQSSANVIFVSFFSDNSESYDGFILTYKAVETSETQTGNQNVTAASKYHKCSTGIHKCSQECVNTTDSCTCHYREGYELKPDGKMFEACGKSMIASNGTVTSPNFSCPNGTCIWHIRTSPNAQINLQFTRMNLGLKNKCVSDRVEIYSIFNSSEKKLGVYCGQQLPDKVKSESNAVRIVFKTGPSGKDAGFSLNFRATVSPCSVNKGNCKRECHYTTDKPTINCACEGKDYLEDSNLRDCIDHDRCMREYASPSGLLRVVFRYYRPLHCKWSFINTPGHRIKLTFKDFQLDACPNENVIFYDGPSANYKNFGVLCGDRLPEPIISSTNQLFATIKLDIYESRKVLVQRSSICGGTLEADVKEENYIYSHANFSLSNYDDNTSCEWIIKTNDGYQVNLAITFFILESSINCNGDHLEIFDGENANAPSLGKFCGSDFQPFVQSSGNILLLQFFTDNSGSDEGFILTYKAVEASETEIFQPATVA